MSPNSNANYKNEQKRANHMYKIIFLTILTACTAKEVTAIDDFIEGEASTAEKIVEDLGSPDPLTGKRKPAVEVRVPIKKF